LTQPHSLTVHPKSSQNSDSEFISIKSVIGKKSLQYYTKYYRAKGKMGRAVRCENRAVPGIVNTHSPQTPCFDGFLYTLTGVDDS